VYEQFLQVGWLDRALVLVGLSRVPTTDACSLPSASVSSVVVVQYTLWVKKTGPFSFEHNFRKYCPILIILSPLQTEIICPQTRNWISHFTYNFFIALPWKCNCILTFAKKKRLNKSAVRAVMALLLQNRKFWWYLLLISSMLLYDVIMMSYCCQRYAECLITTFCSSRTVHRHTAPRTCNCKTAASRNPKLSCAQLVASKQPRSQSCGLRDPGCNAASCLLQKNP